MAVLHSLAEFGVGDRAELNTPPHYWYTGTCPLTHQELRLPRTAQVEAIAQGLMQQLQQDPRFAGAGKMFGVLLVAMPTGERAVLKAFSGCLQGRAQWVGWVPPIPGRAQVTLAETHTLKHLDQLKTKLIALQELPERATYVRLAEVFATRLRELSEQHRQRKAERDRRRALYGETLPGEELTRALADLVRQSQQDGMERRRLKQERRAALEPLMHAIAQADEAIQIIKQQRKALSQDLQRHMHAVYSLTNFAGATVTLQALMPAGLPTGTGDCAAPKLLHYAATHQLKPLALAEFWWGPPLGDKQPGHFYGACAERCQPIMGFLLSGLSTSTAWEPPPASESIPLLYEDEVLLIVNKPSGLLSIPGRTRHLQDSVLSRLRCQRGAESYLATVHRLDKGTSGILILAKSPEVHRYLNAQFAQRQVKKTYEAILSRSVAIAAGKIDLPLWRDPCDRPKQSVCFARGKPSLTEFQILTPGDTPRLRCLPHTGRTHQLRVHAAHPDGLNAPILGDTLYGYSGAPCRLHLHAQKIEFAHPTHQKIFSLVSPVPF